MTAAFDDVDAVVHAAETYMAAGDYWRAESVLGAALGAHPNQPRLLTLYARVNGVRVRTDSLTVRQFTSQWHRLKTTLAEHLP